MQWLKAGRPRKEKESMPEKTGKAWAPEELALISGVGNNAYIMLGIAVVRRWIADGRPSKDEEGVRVWLDIIRDSLKDKSMGQACPEMPEGGCCE